MPKIDPGLAQRQRRSKVAIPALCMILIAISQVSADPVSNPKAGGRPGDLGPYKDPVEAYSTEDGPLRKVSLKQLGEILPGLYGGGPAAPYVYYMDVDNMLSSPVSTTDRPPEARTAQLTLSDHRLANVRKVNFIMT